MKKLLIAASALTFVTTPAHAQLLGGGGLTGGLGSTLDLGGTISRTTDTLRSTTRGAASGDVTTEGSQSVDRRSGRVEARRSANANGAVSVAQLADTPISAISGSASGAGNASGNGEAQTQLIGTDALRSIAGSTAGQVRGTLGAAGNLATPMIDQARSAAPALPGSMPTGGVLANGEGSAAGEGSASLVSAPLAVAGSAAGAAQGAFAIAPGMPVVSPAGQPLGEVRQIVANSRGQVEQIVVEGEDSLMTIPAGDLSANAGALVFSEASAETNSEDTSEEAPAE